MKKTRIIIDADVGMHESGLLSHAVTHVADGLWDGKREGSGHGSTWAVRSIGDDTPPNPGKKHGAALALDMRNAIVDWFNVNSTRLPPGFLGDFDAFTASYIGASLIDSVGVPRSPEWVSSPHLTISVALDPAPADGRELSNDALVGLLGEIAGDVIHGANCGTASGAHAHWKIEYAPRDGESSSCTACKTGAFVPCGDEPTKPEGAARTLKVGDVVWHRTFKIGDIVWHRIGGGKGRVDVATDTLVSVRYDDGMADTYHPNDAADCLTPEDPFA